LIARVLAQKEMIAKLTEQATSPAKRMADPEAACRARRLTIH
jgi:hypothetical protein